jgi:4-amino-4-deoxy-L-arabinose transferase-like glycosyltransferase
MKRSPWNLSIAGLLLGSLLVRSAIALWLPSGFDEAYYYLYTQHWDWSYFDHPPLVALSTGFGVWLTGTVSPFTIRWGSLLLHTGALWLLYRTGMRLFSPPAARLTLTIATIAPIFLLAFGVMTLPDAPLILFWTATLSVASEEFFRFPDRYQPGYRLAIIGLLIGLACLSKYHGVALGIGLLGFCLTTPRYRVALRSPWLLAAIALFLLAILPILIWNWQHDWVSLKFQSGRAIPDRGYSLVAMIGTVLAIAAYLFPTLGLPLWGAIGRSTWQQLRPATAQPQVQLVLWTAVPLMLGFSLMGGYRAILPTWAMPGGWSATLLLGHWAAQWQPRHLRRWLWGSGLAIAALLTVVLSHLRLGTLQTPSQYAIGGGFIPANTDASVQQLDIEQLRQGFAAAGLLTQGDFIFTNDIYLAGQIGMAIAPLRSLPITCFDPDPRGFAFWSTSQEWVGQTGLLVTPQGRASDTIAQYQDYFAQIQKLADLPIRRGGVVVQLFSVYQCRHLLKPYPRPYGNDR